jgi:hypothetical protein
MVVIPLYTLRVLDMSLRDYLVKAYARPLLCALPVALMAYSFSRLEATTWLKFSAEAMSICAVFGIMSYFLCLYSEQRAAVTAKLLGVFRSAPAINGI